MLRGEILKGRLTPTDGTVRLGDEMSRWAADRFGLEYSYEPRVGPRRVLVAFPAAKSMRNLLVVGQGTCTVTVTSGSVQGTETVQVNGGAPKSFKIRGDAPVPKPA